MTVYFIGSSCGLTVPMVKIGYTRGGAKSRCIALQTGCPVTLDVLTEARGYGMEYERALHERFVEHWRHGEWFELADEIWAMIWSIIDGEPLSSLINPAAYPDGLRCEHAINAGGVWEGVSRTREDWPRRPVRVLQ